MLRVRQVAGYMRGHPLQVAATVGGLLIVDWLNVFVRIDRADLLVRIIASAVKPLVRAVQHTWAVVWRAALSFRLVGQ